MFEVLFNAWLLLCLLRVCFCIRSQSEKADNTNLSWMKLIRIGFAGEMICYYVLICSYVAVELGVAAWLMEYLQSVRGQTTSQSFYYLSGFFAMIMLGRFLGSFVVERLGYLRVVAVSLLGGGASLLVGILGPDLCIIALPISGLFFSIVFPTVAAHVTGLQKENNGLLLGLLFTFGGIGGALGPWTVGVVGQKYGLELGLCSMVVFCFIAFSTVAILFAKQSAQAKARA